MGNDVGRVFEGIATLGISELVRALTPQQQAQVDNSQEIVEQHRQEMEKERIRHDQAMQQNAAAQEAANEQLQKVMRQLTEAQQNINTTKEELEKATKAKEEEEANVKKLQDLTEGNVKTFNEAQEFHYAQQLKAVEKLPEVGKTPKKSCAFLGKTSTGKSSCINKLFGAQEKTSPLRCTADIKAVKETDTLQVFDVFGVRIALGRFWFVVENFFDVIILFRHVWIELVSFLFVYDFFRRMTQNFFGGCILSSNIIIIIFCIIAIKRKKRLHETLVCNIFCCVYFEREGTFWI